MVVQDAKLCDNKFYVDFCITCTTYEKLCDILKPYMEHKNSNYKRTSSIQKAIASVFWKLAFGQSDRNVENDFRMERTIVFKYTKLVCKASGDKDKLYSRSIINPSGAITLKIMQYVFNITIILQMCETLDDTRIKIVNKPNRAYTLVDYLVST